MYGSKYAFSIQVNRKFKYGKRMGRQTALTNEGGSE